MKVALWAYDTLPRSLLRLMNTGASCPVSLFVMSTLPSTGRTCAHSFAAFPSYIYIFPYIHSLLLVILDNASLQLKYLPTMNLGLSILFPGHSGDIQYGESVIRQSKEVHTLWASVRRIRDLNQGPSIAALEFALNSKSGACTCKYMSRSLGAFANLIPLCRWRTRREYFI